MKKRSLIFLLLACVCLLTAAGCGKKPSSVDPPQGAENDTFPHTYPAPSK